MLRQAQVNLFSHQEDQEPYGAKASCPMGPGRPLPCPSLSSFSWSPTSPQVLPFVPRMDPQTLREGVVAQVGHIPRSSLPPAALSQQLSLEFE